jgi:hypothetical protein
VRALKRIVTSAVLVVLPKAGTDLEVQILRDGRIARLEQPVEIRPEQQTIANLVRSVMRVLADVGRFERRKGVLSRNGASTTVSIEDGDSESSLTETGLNETRFTVARTAFCGNQKLRCWCDRSSVDHP